MNKIAPPAVVFPPGPTDLNPAEIFPSYPESDDALRACIAVFLDFAAGKGGVVEDVAVFPNWLIPASGPAKSFASASDLGNPSPIPTPYKLAVRTTHPGEESMFVDVVVEHEAGRSLLAYDPAEVGKEGPRRERAEVMLGKVEGVWKIRARCNIE